MRHCGRGINDQIASQAPYLFRISWHVELCVEQTMGLAGWIVERDSRDLRRRDAGAIAESVDYSFLIVQLGQKHNRTVFEDLVESAA